MDMPNKISWREVNKNDLKLVWKEIDRHERILKDMFRLLEKLSGEINKSKGELS